MVANRIFSYCPVFIFSLLAAFLCAARPAQALDESVLFTKDGTCLLIARESSVEVWKWRKCEKVQSLGGHRDTVRTMALSHDGRVLATAAESVILWNTGDWKELGRIEGEGITGLAFKPDGSSIAVASSMGHVAVWDLKKMKRTKCLRHPNPVTSVAWSPDSRYLAAAESPDEDLGPACLDAIAFWEGSSDILIRRTSCDRFWVNHIVFSPDGKVLASAGYQPSAYVWDISTAFTLARLACGIEALRAIDFSPDGRFMAVGGDSAMVSLWSRDGKGYSSWTPCWSIDTGRQVGSVAISPDCSVIAVGPAGVLLDARTGKKLPSPE